MRSANEKLGEFGEGSHPCGAGGEPPAPPRGLLDGLPDDIRRQLPEEVVDEILARCGKRSREIGGRDAMLSPRTRRLAERALDVEPTHQLGHEPQRDRPGGTGDTRSASTATTLPTKDRPCRSTRHGIATGS